jgi:signal transduction histidine kinase
MSNTHYDVISPLPKPAVRSPFSVPLKAAMRAITLVTLVATIIPWLVGQPLLYEAMLTPCEPNCDITELTSAEIAAFEAHHVSVEFYAAIIIIVGILVIIAFTLCCLLLLWKLSDNWTGWVATLIFAGSTLIPVGLDYGMEHLAIPVEGFRVFGSIFATYFIVFLYIFPSGQFYPHALKWPILILLAIRFLSGADTIHYEERSLWYFFWVFFWVALFVLGTVSQFFRYRRATSEVERLQTRWVIFSLFVMALGIVVGSFMTELWANQAGAPRGFILLIAYPFLMLTTLPLPVAITFAILRYKLWNIDLIINRTLVYGILTALVLGIYVAVVGGLSAVFNATDNQVFALIATGIVAFSFQGLHQRVQRTVNRMMFGQRDEPQVVLSSLSRQLQTAILPEDLLQTSTATISTSLKIPYVAIAVQQGANIFKQAEYGRNGFPTQTFALIHQNETVGELIVGQRSPNETLNPADQSVLASIAGQLGAVVYAVRLQSDLQTAREKLVIAREEERRRLRRDLHDGLGPALASQTLKIDAALDSLTVDPDEARGLLTDVKAQSQKLVTDVRRLVYELRPPALDEIGLVGALSSAVAQLRATEKGLNILIETPPSLPELPAAVEVAAYRITMEAITNVIKHADAHNCTVRLTVTEKPAQLRLEIQDDGKGLPLPVTSGIGLQSMRERAEELGGMFDISAAASGGTRVEVSLPLTRGQR